MLVRHEFRGSHKKSPPPKQKKSCQQTNKHKPQSCLSVLSWWSLPSLSLHSTIVYVLLPIWQLRESEWESDAAQDWQYWIWLGWGQLSSEQPEWCCVVPLGLAQGWCFTYCWVVFAQHQSFFFFPLCPSSKQRRDTWEAGKRHNQGRWPEGYSMPYGIPLSNKS